MRQQLDLIAGQRWLRQQFQETRLDRRDAGRQRQQQALHAGLGQGIGHDFLHGHHPRPAQFIGLASATSILQRLADRIGHVADIDRLHTGVAAIDQRQRRRETGQLGKAIEKVIFRPEHDAGPDHGGARECLSNRSFPMRLALGVERIAVCVGPDGRKVHQLRRPSGGRCLGNAIRTFGLHRVERLCAAFEKHAHQVHHPVHALARRRDRLGVAHVGQNGGNLPDGAHRLQELGALDVSAGNPHRMPSRRQPLDHIAADKTRAAKYHHTRKCHCRRPHQSRNARRAPTLFTVDMPQSAAGGKPGIPSPLGCYCPGAAMTTVAIMVIRSDTCWPSPLSAPDASAWTIMVLARTERAGIGVGTPPSWNCT